MTGDPKQPSEDHASEDHAYFRAVEDCFIRLRGAPLLLSPADWQVAKEWHRQGVPLELVRRTLEQVFERRRERGADDLVTLRYFRRPVARAWREIRELAAGGQRAEAQAFDLAGRLENLAAALPQALPGRVAWAERIRALAAGEAAAEGTAEETPGEEEAEVRELREIGRMEAVEEELDRLDRELLEAATGALDREARERLDAGVEEALDRLRERLPGPELERSREQLRRRRLRAELGLPVLSLFSPAAEGKGAGEGTA